MIKKLSSNLFIINLSPLSHYKYFLLNISLANYILITLETICAAFYCYTGKIKDPIIVSTFEHVFYSLLLKSFPLIFIFFKKLCLYKFTILFTIITFQTLCFFFLKALFKTIIIWFIFVSDTNIFLYLISLYLLIN